MLVCASNATERGRTHNWCDEDVASALDLECVAVTSIRDAMQGRVLDGDYLKGWEHRQPKREDNSATRAREWREEQKRIMDEERNRTQPNAEKRPEEDTDTEEDTEKRREGVSRPPAIDFDHLISVWNETAGQVCPKVVKLIESRRRTLRNRISDTFDGTTDKWRDFCIMIQKSHFLTGNNDRGWKADFDWAIKPQNAAKIMEGKYENTNRSTANHSGTTNQQGPVSEKQRTVAAYADIIAKRNAEADPGMQGQPEPANNTSGPNPPAVKGLW